MKNIADLILDARLLSKNVDFQYDSATGVVARGIGDDEFLVYFNHYQDQLQAKISQTNPQTRPFVLDKELSIVAGQQAYAVNDRVFFQKEYLNVEHSYSGNDFDYTPLRKASIFNNNTNQTDYPSAYYRQNNQVYLIPVPSTSQGSLRIKYERSLDDLDKRRGTVTARTLSATQLTALTISTTGDDAAAIQNKNDKYLCINDADGNVKMYNVPYTSYDSATGVFTLSAFTFQTGESVAVGDYITLGKYTTTHSKLIDEAEACLVYSVATIILARDSSNDVSKMTEILSDYEKAVIRQYKNQSAEIQNIPEANQWEWY